MQLYGVPKDVAETDRRLLDRRLDLAHSAAVLLDKHNLIKYDRRSGNFQVNSLARRSHVHACSLLWAATQQGVCCRRKDVQSQAAAEEFLSKSLSQASDRVYYGATPGLLMSK